MVFIAVRTDFTALTVQNAEEMFAQETSSVQELEGLNAAGDAAVNPQKSSQKRTKPKKKKKVGAQAQPVVELEASSNDVEREIVPNGHVDEGGSSRFEHFGQQTSPLPFNQPLMYCKPRECQSVSQQTESLLLEESSVIPAANSYAAAVSGRKLKDSWGQTGFLSVDSTSAFSSMISPQPLKKSNSTSSLVAVTSKCDKEYTSVGVQTSPSDVSSNGAELNGKAEGLKYVCQETMTSRTTGCKNKAVVAKLCGCSDEKFPPPVEFHGRCFTFENTIAKQFAEMGISFFEAQDEDNNPGIH
ncbi:unnamed protein product [Orchesella dallaii]|uniref:Uncharacterized protein n=1 Tax=Orchesella dallaii TaxID=48710 RepID=A0ABP1QXK7_9HEXA